MVLSVSGPKQIVLVTSRAMLKNPVTGDDMERDNVVTIAWHTCISSDPLMYGVAIAKSHYSAKLITESKAFVVNFLTADMEEEAIKAGSRSGEHFDKIKDFEVEDADNVDCFRLKKAVAYMECEVVNELELGDHMLYIGKVVNQYVDKGAKRLIHLGGKEFTTTEK